MKMGSQIKKNSIDDLPKKILHLKQKCDFSKIYELIFTSVASSLNTFYKKWQSFSFRFQSFHILRSSFILVTKYRIYEASKLHQLSLFQY